MPMKEIFAGVLMMIVAIVSGLILTGALVYAGTWFVFLTQTKLPWPPPYKCFW